MSYQLLFKTFNYRRGTTLSKTLQAFKARGTAAGFWHTLSKKYYISPLVYCCGWQSMIEPDEDDFGVHPMEYCRMENKFYLVDSDDDYSLLCESIVKKKPKNKRRARKKINVNKRR